jgi:hypothetical protein
MPSIVSTISFKYCGQTVGTGWFRVWETNSSYPQQLAVALGAWVQSVDLSQTTHVFYHALSTRKTVVLQRCLGVYTHYAQGLLIKLLFIYK